MPDKFDQWLEDQLGNFSKQQREAMWEIQFRLYWYGTVTRRDLKNTFGISEKVAKSFLGLYLDKLKLPLARDSGKSYRATDDFRVGIQSSVEEFLHRLASENNSYSPYVEPEVSDRPHSVEGRSTRRSIGFAAPEDLIRRPIQREHLREFVNAISRKRVLRIRYHATNAKEPASLLVAPYALTHDSFRWAARCWRSDRQTARDTFGDIVLDRIEEIAADVGDANPHQHGDGDKGWAEISVQVGPNKGLAEQDRARIERQYNIDPKSHALVRKMPKCMYVYFLKRYQLEEPVTLKRPFQAPISIINRDEVEAAIPEHMLIPLRERRSGSKVGRHRYVADSDSATDLMLQLQARFPGFTEQALFVLSMRAALTLSDEELLERLGTIGHSVASGGSPIMTPARKAAATRKARFDALPSGRKAHATRKRKAAAHKASAEKDAATRSAAGRKAAATRRAKLGR